MSRTKAKVLIIIFVIVLIAATVSVSFAWFIDGILSDRFKFTVAYVDSQVTLYRGEDFNHDGTIDVNAAGAPIFTELGDSNNGSIKLDSKGNPIYSGGKPVYDKDVNIKFEINAIMPSQVYSWKLKVQNLGDVKALMFAEFVADVDVDNGIYGLDVLSARVNNVGKYYFGQSYNATLKQQIVTVIYGDELDYSLGLNFNPNSVREYIVQIEFESYDNLVAAGVAISHADYQAYKSRVVNNINMRVRLEDSRTSTNP